MADPAGSSGEPFRHPMGIEEFRGHAKALVDLICDYYANIASFPVRSNVEQGYLGPLLPEEAPARPQPFAQLLSAFRAHILPGVTHWQSPSFFAFFPANSSFPAMLGDMLCSALGVIGFSWVGSPAATELETIVLDWLARLLSLPECFLAGGTPTGELRRGGGVIQGTTSEAVVVAMLAARGQALQGRPPGDIARLVAYSSDQAHSCFQKACMIAGISHARCQATSRASEYGLAGEGCLRELGESMRRDREAGLLPFFLMGSIGTTSSCAVDDVDALGSLAEREQLWFHVDAAYAGVAGMLPECQHHFQGLERAHSYSLNAHKWLLTNFDCCVLWVRDAGPLRAALAVSAAFLRNKGNERDFKDWQIPLGRRFRALKLWFVLHTYGGEGLRAYLRHHLALSARFGARLRGDPRFCLAAEPRFGLTCFAVQGLSDAESKAMLEELNASGRLFMISTELEGRFVFRFAIGSALTQAEHVDAAWEQISAAADRALAQQGKTAQPAANGKAGGEAAAAALTDAAELKSI